MKKSLKVIIDTNLWISFLINNDLQKLDKYILSKKISLVFSEELLNEFLIVTSRPKLQKHFKHSDVELLIELFDNYAYIIDIKSNIIECRDSKDNFLLSLAYDSNADFLITGDNDLLVLKELGKTKIITIKDFLSIIKNYKF